MSFNDDGEKFHKKTGVPLRKVESFKRDIQEGRAWPLLRQLANSDAPDAKGREAMAVRRQSPPGQEVLRWRSPESARPSEDFLLDHQSRPARREQFAGLFRKDGGRAKSSHVADKTLLKPLLRRIADLSGSDHGEDFPWR